jgi:hypothetical protein
MAYALMQQTVDRPSVELMREAFRSVPGLTAPDASMLARDACGILAENLPLETANALQQALKARGIEAEVADQGQLPPLPHPLSLKRAACLEDALVVYDALGRERKVPWKQVYLIAAGSVELTEYKRASQEYVFHGMQRGTIHIIEFSDKQEQNLRLVLEIFVEGQPGRYGIQADRFGYEYLGQRLGRNAAENFVLLVRDLMRLAPHAGTNRGAGAIAQEPPRVFRYPSQRAFEHESLWLIWKGQQASG